MSLCRDGWTLLLKSDADRTLGYNDPLWTDNHLLNEGDMTLDNRDAKYAVFMTMPVSELKATFPSKGSGYTFQTGVMGSAQTASAIFSQGNNVHNPGGQTWNDQWPAGWSNQPNCKRFGINLADPYRGARFGFLPSSGGGARECSHSRPRGTARRNAVVAA